MDGEGLVTAVGVGSAEITAMAGSATGRAALSVMAADRAVLVTLYEAMGGANWDRTDN